MKRYIYEGICKECGKFYTPSYVNSNGCVYSMKTDFCSKKCAAAFNAQRGIGAIQVDRGRDALLEEALEFMRSKGSYCTLVELSKAINVSSKTLTKHKIRVRDLNRELNYVRKSSQFQNQVKRHLDTLFEGIECEVGFEGLVGNTGYPLRVDFYIPSLNLVIEADGAQHSNPDHIWANWATGSVQEYDLKKDTYFKINNINLVRIPYRRNVTLSFVKEYLKI